MGNPLPETCHTALVLNLPKENSNEPLEPSCYWKVLLLSGGRRTPRRKDDARHHVATFHAAGAAREPIEIYFQAHATGDPELIRRAFAPEATIRFVENGQAKSWTVEEFATRFKGPAEDEYRRVRRIDSLTINGDIGSAVLTLDYPQVRFTDYFSLIKSDGTWKIVSKLFHADRKQPETAKQETLREWMQPIEPFKVIGNIYYVGSSQISSFLITTPAGHILLDSGPAEMLPQLKANIEKLGFRVADIKLLINSHAHFDHSGGFAALKHETGAKLLASDEDGKLLSSGGRDDFAWGNDLEYEPVQPDQTVHDGERIYFGGATLTATLTPGHTRGCTTWSMKTLEAGKTYDVVFVCGLTVSTYKLNDNPRYPEIVQQARGSLDRLGAMHADVMLAPHGFYFDLKRKIERRKTGSSNPFFDATELQRHIFEMSQDLEHAVKSQQQPAAEARKQVQR